MKSAVFVFIAAIGATATSLGAQPRNIDVRLRGYQQAVRLDTVVLWNVIPASAAQTFAATRHVLDSLDIPLSTVDSVNGLFFRSPFNTARQILGRRMSWALNCGEGLNGSKADFYRIHMAYALFLEPTSDGQTRLGTALAAGASSTEGASIPPIRCGSTGAFENEIATRVRAQVQAERQ
jgi:hypothetical protein